MADEVEPLPIMRLAAAAATELGLQPEFVFDLIKEDDWSFVVKAHAFLESIVTQALLEHVAETRLHDNIAKLGLLRKRSLLEAVEPELFNRRDRRFMNALGELRNRLVHNVRRIGFTFEEELSDNRAVRKFVGDFSAPLPVRVEPDINAVSFTPQYAKLVAWSSLTVIAAKVQGYKEGRRPPSVRGFQQALVDALMKGSADAGPSEPAGPDNDRQSEDVRLLDREDPSDP